MENFPDTLRVAVIPIEHLFEIHEDSSDGAKRYSGVEAKFLQLLAEALDFKFRPVVPADFKWGTLDDSGNWSGIVGMLRSNAADIGLSYLDITKQRASAINFSVPYDAADKSFAVDHPELLPKYAAFAYPFSPSAWGSILAAYVAACVILGLLSSKQSSWTEVVFGVFGTLCRQPYACTEDSTPTWKVAFAAWSLFIAVFTACYAALLFSYLANPCREQGVETVSELAAAVRAGTHLLQVVEGSQDLKILLDSQQEDVHDLGQAVLAHGWFYGVTDDPDMSRRVGRRTAIMADRTWLSMPEFHEKFVSDDSFGVWSVGIGYSKSFCCRERLDTAILRTLSAGIYQKFKEDERQFRSALYRDESPLESQKTIALEDTYGLFLILLVGYAAAFLAFAGELVVFYWLKILFNGSG